MVDVLVAARDLPAGYRVGAGAVAIRRVPARFVPRDALASPAGVAGARLAVPVASGSYVSAGLFEGGKDRGDDGAVRKGERAVTVEVAGGSAVAGLAPAARVDVLISTESAAGAGRTTLALAGAELLGLSAAEPGAYDDPDGAAGAAAGPTALATLRVSLRHAIYLTAADNFAREIRLLPHPPGDSARPGGAVEQGQL
jgi:pilus assembly protein CpaB